LADVFLDTYPYNCGSTTNDVIEAGVPIVTCAGRTMVSRMGASVLHALGQEALIAENLVDYKSLVVDLAKHPTNFKRQSQRPQKSRTDDRKRMVRSLESGLLSLLREAVAGEFA